MSDLKRPKGNPRWVKGGASPNPGGRPRSALALAEAIRRGVDPDELVRIAVAIASDPDKGARDRVAALQWLSSSGYTRPPQGLAIQVSAPAALPASWSAMSRAEREMYLDSLTVGLLAPGDDEHADADAAQALAEVTADV